ncbi:hypothetical protein WAI453_004737 [Rhynchosporium graminicola]
MWSHSPVIDPTSLAGSSPNDRMRLGGIEWQAKATLAITPSAYEDHFLPGGQDQESQSHQTQCNSSSSRRKCEDHWTVFQACLGR